MKPTFDEWFEKKHGASFDHIYMQPGMLMDTALRALTHAMREYVSEVVGETERCR